MGLRAQQQKLKVDQDGGNPAALETISSHDAEAASSQCRPKADVDFTNATCSSPPALLTDDTVAAAQHRVQKAADNV